MDKMNINEVYARRGGHPLSPESRAIAISPRLSSTGGRKRSY